MFAMAVLLCLPVLAQGLTYEEPAEEYSFEDARFYYRFSDGTYFKSMIPNGQITLGFVSVEFSEGLTWALEFDGTPMEYNSGDYIYGAGMYRFVVTSPRSGVYGEFSFQIAEVNVRPGGSSNVHTVVLDHSFTDGLFRYGFENGRAFSASVPNGAITNYAVQIYLDRELIALLTKDGAAVNHESGDALTEDGYYHLRVISPMAIDIPDLSWYDDDDTTDPNQTYTEEDLLRALEDFDFDDGDIPNSLERSAIYQTSFTFRIVTRPTRELAVFNAPLGFEFGSVYLGGTKIEPSGLQHHRFDRDGVYAFSLIDKSGQAPEQIVALTIDTTPPDIRLVGVTKGFATSGPVSLEVGETGLDVTVVHNGMSSPVRDEFIGSGYYTVTVRDEAGNTATLGFQITFAPARTTVLLVILGAIVAVGGYVVYSRRTMTV
jgi:hypothetical protein